MQNPLTSLTTFTASLFDQAGRFTVIDTCSGVNSLKALLALALILAFINRNKPSRVFILAFTAGALAIIFNQLRVAALILLGDLPADSWQIAHTLLGFLSVLPSIYILIHLSKRMSTK